MHKYTAILLLIVGTMAWAQDSTRVPDEVLETIFGKTPEVGDQRGKRSTEGGEECKAEGKIGQCVPYYACESLLELSQSDQDGHALKVDKECTRYLEVCCVVSNGNS